MSIQHLELDSLGRLSKSELITNNCRIALHINCLEIYSHNVSISSKNKIAELLESYRRKDIGTEEFKTRYIYQQENLKKIFREKLKIFDESFFVYFAKSQDKFINRILEELKSESLRLFQSKGSKYTDISDCLIKKTGTPASNKQTFETVIINYDFNPGLLWDPAIHTYRKVNRLLFIDDVISKGKTIFALLNNLHIIKAVDSSSFIYANVIYCIEKRLQNIITIPND